MYQTSGRERGRGRWAVSVRLEISKYAKRPNRLHSNEQLPASEIIKKKN